MKIKTRWKIALVYLILPFLLIMGCGGTKPKKKTPGTSEFEVMGTMMTLKNLAPENISVGASNIKFAQLTIASDQEKITWSRLKLEQVGNARDEDPPNGRAHYVLREHVVWDDRPWRRRGFERVGTDDGGDEQGHDGHCGQHEGADGPGGDECGARERPE